MKNFKILVVIALLSNAITLSAQDAKKQNDPKKGAFELVAGINFVMPELKATDKYGNTLTNNGFGNGFKVGVNYNVFAGRNNLSPKHLKLGTGCHFQQKNAEFFEDGNSVMKINTNYLTIPLYVRIAPFRQSSISEKLFVELISEFDYMINSKLTIGNHVFSGNDAAQLYRKFNYSAGLSLGYWFMKIQYNFINSNMVSDKFQSALSSELREFSIKPSVITISFSFEF